MAKTTLKIYNGHDSEYAEAQGTVSKTHPIMAVFSCDGLVTDVFQCKNIAQAKSKTAHDIYIDVR